MICNILAFCSSSMPSSKEEISRSCREGERVLGTVKIFDELVSPQSLFLHFLGPEPSNKVWKNLEVVKKSECFMFSSLFFFYFLFF